MARESTIKLEFDLEGPTDVPVLLVAPGITKGPTTQIHVDPTDVTAVADGFAVNGYIKISGTGWKTLDNRLHIITAWDSGTDVITIATDTSAETAALPALLTDIKVVHNNLWTHVCLSEFTPSPGTPAEIDATTMCDVERVNLPGLPSAGTANFTGMFDLDDAGMLALREAYDSGDERWFVATTRKGQVAMFYGVISSFTMGALTVEAAVTFTGTMTLKQAPSYGRVSV